MAAMTTPEITPEMRAAALSNPNSWLYVIDPALDPDDDVPPWGVVGAYPVNEFGQIDEAFEPNAEYRPTPVAIKEPDSAAVLEALLERVRAGERPERDLLPAVLAARLLLYAGSAEDGSVTGFPNRDGSVMVPACTSPERVPAAWPGWREVSGRDLLPLLYGHPLVINPSGPVTALIPADHLLAASRS
jgi:hypothetical protein